MIPLVIIAVVVVKIIIAICEAANSNSATRKSYRKLRIAQAGGVLGNNFIDSRHLFVKLNKDLPSVLLINAIDVNKAMQLVEAELGNSIKTVYRHKQFDFNQNEIVFNVLIVVANNRRVIEVGNNYVELLYTADQSYWADCFAKALAQFQLPAAGRALTGAVCVRGFAGQMN